MDSNHGEIACFAARNVPARRKAQLTKNACRLGEPEKPARYRRASAPSACSPFSREKAIPFILASFPRNARWRR